MSRQFEHALNARRPSVYWTRVNDIQETGSRDAFNLARAYLASKDPRRRRLGADVLAELGFQQWPRPFSRPSAPLLLAALDREKNPLALAALINAVGRLYIRRAIPKLLKLAGHRSPEVRRALASEMPGCTWDSGEERPDSRVTALLIELTTDRVAEVRGWACFSLAGSVADSPKIRDVLWDRVRDRHYDTRIDALRGLAIRRDPRVHQPLRDAVGAIGTGRFGSWAMDDLIDYAKAVRDRQLLKALKG